MIHSLWCIVVLGCRLLACFFCLLWTFRMPVWRVADVADVRLSLGTYRIVFVLQSIFVLNKHLKYYYHNLIQVTRVKTILLFNYLLMQVNPPLIHLYKQFDTVTSCMDAHILATMGHWSVMNESLIRYLRLKMLLVLLLSFGTCQLVYHSVAARQYVCCILELIVSCNENMYQLLIVFSFHNAKLSYLQHIFLFELVTSIR